MHPQAPLGVLLEWNSKTEKENLNSEITWAPEGSCCPVRVGAHGCVSVLAARPCLTSALGYMISSCCSKAHLCTWRS